MSAEVIINAIGDIDEELITGCNELRSKYSFKPRPYVRWLSMAAGLVLVSFIGIFAMLKPAEINPVSLSGSEWWHHKNPIIFTERPEKEQVAVKPTDTPEPTVAPTIDPMDVPVVTAQSTEIPPEPTETGTNWEEKCTMFLAMMEPEYGNGFNFNGETSIENSDINIYRGDEDYTDEFFIKNAEWKYEFYLNDGLYIARVSSLSKDDIDTYMGEVDVSIWERYFSKHSFIKRLPMYSIKNLDTEIFVAIKISEEEYYLFRNVRYDSGGVSGFVTNYDLKNKVVIKSSAYKSINDAAYTNEMPVTDSSAIWDALATVDVDREFVYEDNLEDLERICLNTDSNFYGFYNMPISFFENGNVVFKYFGHSYIFNIGSEGYKEIFDLTRGDFNEKEDN